MKDFICLLFIRKIKHIFACNDFRKLVLDLDLEKYRSLTNKNENPLPVLKTSEEYNFRFEDKGMNLNEL